MISTSSNGTAHHQSNGRSVPEYQYHSFTFATGITIAYRRVAASALKGLPQALAKDARFKKPEPPVDMTDLGPMPNESHPDYVQAYKEWEQRFQEELGERTAKIAIAIGVECQVDEQETRRTLKHRQRYGGLDIGDLDLGDPDDLKVAYILYVCLAGEDIQPFLNAILRKSVVTPEVVAEKIDSFRGDVGRDADLRMQDNALGSEI